MTPEKLKKIKELPWIKKNETYDISLNCKVGLEWLLVDIHENMYWFSANKDYPKDLPELPKPILLKGEIIKENKNSLELGKRGTPNSLIKEIDSLIELMTSPDRDFLTKKTMTKPLPKDTKICPNSNKDKPFFLYGALSRHIEKLKSKKLLMEKEEITQEELDEISTELNDVKSRIREKFNMKL